MFSMFWFDEIKLKKEPKILPSHPDSMQFD